MADLPIFDVEHEPDDHHIRLYSVDELKEERELIAIFPASTKTDRYAAAKITYFIIDYMRNF